MVEHSAVNRVVTGSNPVRGAIFMIADEILNRCFPVTIAEGPHLYPYRTEKLSLPTLMILRGFSLGKVRRCRNKLTPFERQLFFWRDSRVAKGDGL